MRFWKKTATLFTCLLTSFGMVACGTFAGHSGADASVDGVDSADSSDFTAQTVQAFFEWKRKRFADRCGRI